MTATFPAELRKRRQWIAYRLEPNPDRPDKPDKVPYCTPTRHASHADSATWLSFKDACALAEQEGFAGIGFVFSEDDPYVGIDLDGCRNPETGDVAEWARRIIAQCASYTELSQSGAGFHIIVKGTLPEGIRHKREFPGTAGGKQAALEVYARLRYFVMTGQVRRKRHTIKRRPQALDSLIAQYLTRAVPGTTVDLPVRGRHLLDDDVLARTAAANPTEFHRLYDAGETRPGKSDSESDYQLACMFARQVGGDAERIERLMRQSALVRDKWDTHPSYLVERTIARAIDTAARERPPTNGDDPMEQRFFSTLLEIKRNPALMQVPAQLLRCVAWPGHVSLFSGAEKSAGKSTFLAAASAAITRGKPFIDAPTCTPPGAILWVSADEEHTSGIVTRLQGFKAKLKRLALLYPSGTLEERLTELEQYVRELRPTLVIIDTLSNFARVKDPFGSTEWPEIILRVKRLAREQNVAAVLVHHTTKADDEQYRDSSSIGATVDQKVTLSRVDQKNSTSLQRWLKTVGRCTLRPEDVCIELTETGYAVVTNPTVDLAGRIRSYLATHPNVSQRALEQAIGGNSRRFRTMLKRLVEENDVARRQVGRDVLYALNDGRGVAADELAIS